MTISGKIYNAMFAKTPDTAAGIYEASGKIRMHALDPHVIQTHHDLTDFQKSLPRPDKISFSHRSFSGAERGEIRNMQESYNRLVHGMRVRNVELRDAEAHRDTLQRRYDKNPVAQEALRDRLGDAIIHADNLAQTQRAKRIEFRNMLVDYSALRIADQASRRTRRTAMNARLASEPARLRMQHATGAVEAPAAPPANNATPNDGPVRPSRRWRANRTAQTTAQASTAETTPAANRAPVAETPVAERAPARSASPSPERIRASATNQSHEPQSADVAGPSS